MGSQETKIQNKCRIALSPHGTFFRANNGLAWTGNKIAKLKDGSILILDPRPFRTGLPDGFPDLFGYKPTKITPEMIGQTIAVFAGIEIKSEKGRATEEQKNFIRVVKQNGGIAGVARSPDEAVAIIREGNSGKN